MITGMVGMNVLGVVWLIGAGLAGWFVPRIASFVLQKKRLPVPIIKRSLSFWMATLFFVLYALVLLYKSEWMERFIAFFFLWLLLLLALTDCWAGILPNWFTYTGIILFFLFRLLDSSQPADSYLFGGIFGWGFLYLLAKMTGGIGLGDSKLLAMIGLLVGFPLVLVALWLAAGSALVHVLVFRISFKEKIPFGPHLAFGAIVSDLWGEKLLQIYFS